MVTEIKIQAESASARTQIKSIVASAEGFRLLREESEVTEWNRPDLFPTYCSNFKLKVSVPLRFTFKTRVLIFQCLALNKVECVQGLNSARVSHLLLYIRKYQHVWCK